MEAQGGAVVRRQAAPQQTIFAARATRAGDASYWAADGGIFRVWDASNGSKRVGFRHLGLGKIEDLRLSADGSTLAAIAFRHVQLFDLGASTEADGARARPTGAPARVLVDDLVASVRAIELDPRGERLALSTDDGLYIYDTASARRLLELECGDIAPAVLRFDAGAHRLFAGVGSEVRIFESAALEGSQEEER